MVKCFLLIVFSASTLFLTGCGGSAASNPGTPTSPGSPTSPPGPGTPVVPQLAHVFILVEENHGYSEVIGNAGMPYFNGLAAKYSLATQYYANAHPSLPNYFMLTTGATIATDDSYTGTVTQDNVVQALRGAGKTWRCYAESLPSVGYTGPDVLPYGRRHDPFAYFAIVQSDPTQAGNIVPFTQMASDLANNNLPDYAFIVPNLNDDAHDCPAGMSSCTDTDKLVNADTWLKNNIDGLINSPAFANSLLIITFDEGNTSDVTHGGGNVPTALIGSGVKAGYRSKTLYQHESTLRLMMEVLGVTDLPGAAANASDMTEFFPN